MKNTFLLFFCICSFVLSADLNQTQKELRKQKAIQEAGTREKICKRTKFYKYDNYDFKGAEVNKESLESVPTLEPQYDFDMNHVYD